MSAYSKSMKQRIYITLVGAFILSAWGAFSWQVLPWHQSCVKQFNNEAAVMSALSNNAHEAGLYLLPYSKEDRETSRVFMYGLVNKNWHKPSQVSCQIFHFLMHAIAVYIVAWLFMHLKPLSYWRKVGFITLVGLFAGAVVVLPYWNFLNYPFYCIIISILDITIGWFLAGLAIAKIHSEFE